VKSQWEAVGVTAQIRVLERATLRDQREKGNFQALLGGWSTNLALDLRPVWGCGAAATTSSATGTAGGQPERCRPALPYAQAKPLLHTAQAPGGRRPAVYFLYALELVVGTSERLRGGVQWTAEEPSTTRRLVVKTALTPAETPPG